MVAHEPWPKNRGNGSNGFPTWQWDITGIKHRARLISGGLWLKSRYIVLHNYMIYIYIYRYIMCIVFCFRSSGAIGPYQLKSLAMSFPGWKAPSPLGVFDWRKALHLSTSISSISAAWQAWHPVFLGKA